MTCQQQEHGNIIQEFYFMTRQSGVRKLDAASASCTITTANAAA